MSVPSLHQLPDCVRTLPVSTLLLPPQAASSLRERDPLQQKLDEMRTWIQQSGAKPKKTLKEEIDNLFTRHNSSMVNTLTSMIRTVNAAASQLRLTVQTSNLQLRRQQVVLEDVRGCYAGLAKFRLLKELKSKSKPKPPPEGMYM